MNHLTMQLASITSIRLTKQDQTQTRSASDSYLKHKLTWHKFYILNCSYYWCFAVWTSSSPVNWTASFFVNLLPSTLILCMLRVNDWVNTHPCFSSATLGSTFSPTTLRAAQPKFSVRLCRDRFGEFDAFRFRFRFSDGRAGAAKSDPKEMHHTPSKAKWQCKFFSHCAVWKHLTTPVKER